MIDKITKYEKSGSKKYDFTILMPTWNNLEYLKLCISSVQKNSELDIQIIVFVNEGVDGTLDWLNEQHGIDYVHAEDNAGICYALNLCRSLVKSEYIVYMNDDMYALPGWDIELNNEISQMSDKSFMLSATMIEPIDVGNPCVIVADYGDTTETFDEEGLLKNYESFEKSNWSGSTWPPNVMHVDLWDLVGGMSVEFSPGMYSDPDLSKKLYDAGVRVFKGVGKSRVYHFGTKTTRKLKKSRGRELFLLKWGITSNVFRNKILKMGQPYARLNDKIDYKSDIRIGKLKIFKMLFNSRRSS
jgi:glycosyltransferase involved in cell wall biosynthesis